MSKLRSAVLWFVMVTQIWTPVLAQNLPISVDKSVAGQRPVVGVANGVPIINIAPPEGGVSNNRFNQFNVGPSGVVMNNSGGASQSQLAGVIAGNPMLGNEHAAIILNQVTGANPSQLAGMLEVAGNRASVIVANPAGITCNGCGFLNANRATLTTGRPVIGPNGLAFDVTGGRLAIEGAGLNGSNLSQVDLLARTMVINARVWADRLNVVAGAAHVGYDGVAATPMAGQGPAPVVALDTAALGSMYANSIRLIGTEAGLGVNVGGNLTSLTGTIQVSVNGDVKILPTARVQAATDVSLQSGGQVANSGMVAAGGALAVQAQGLRNSGTMVASAGSLTATVASGVNNAGGTLGAKGALELHAPSLGNAGGVVSGDNVVLAMPGGIDNQRGTIQATRALTVAGGALLNLGGKLLASTANLQPSSVDNRQGVVQASGNLAVATAGALNNAGGTVVSRQAVALHAQSLTNTGGLIAGEGVTAGTAAGIDNQHGTIQATGALALAGSDLKNQAGKILAATADIKTNSLDNRQGVVQTSGNLAVNTAGALNNAGGTVSSKGAVVLHAQSLGNASGVVSGGSVAVSAAGGIDNQHGAIQANRGLAIDGGKLDNQGGKLLAGSADIKASALDNTHGVVVADGHLALRSTGDLKNQNGGLYAGAADIHTGSLDNQGGKVVSGGALDLHAGTGLDNTGGTVAARGQANVQAQRVTNTRGLLAAAGLHLNTPGAVDNRAGLIQADGTLEVAAARLDNRDTGAKGAVGAGGSGGPGALGVTGAQVALRTGTIDNHSGRIDASRSLELTTPQLDNSGKIVSRGDLKITTGTLTNRAGGEIVAAKNNVLNVAGALINAGVIDGGYTRIDAASVTNTGRIYGDRIGIKTQTLANEARAVIASRGDMDLGVGTLTNREHGLIYAGGELRVGGTLDAAGRATGQAQRLANESATIEVAGKAQVTAASIENRNLHFASETTEVSHGKKLYYRLKNSTKLMDGSKLWLCDQVSTLCARNNPGEFLDDDAERRLLLPSKKYPESRYGPPFDYVAGVKGKAGESAPIPPAWIPDKQVCTGTGGDAGGTCTKVPGGPRYKAGDRVWQVFGVPEPVAVPPMVEVECGFHKTCLQSTPERDRALALNKSRSDELDSKIHAFNADFNDRLVADFFYYQVDEKVKETRTVSSDPAKIIVGGNATLTGAVTNDKSRIVAGGTLKIDGPVKNIGAIGERVVERTGTETRTEEDGRRRREDTSDYHDVVAPERIELSVGTTVGNAALPATGNQKPGANTAGAQAPARVLEFGVPGGNLVRVVMLAPVLPQNLMFQIVANPGAPTLIATDSQFLHGRQYASSDLLLQDPNVDRGHILKRLGDGFYEQRLVAEQIMLATGQRFVGDYRDNETQFKALLRAGAAFARKFHLTVGTALSRAQMNQLTSDIVWMETQTVTLPDGTKQQVLVPRVYLAVRPGDLRGDGTLIAGRDLQVKTDGDVSNSGSLAARTALVVQAKNIRNEVGTIQAQTVDLSARRDLDNVAGLLKGESVALAAGRDINLKATTRSSGNAEVSSTHIDGVARVDAGKLAMRAGRDVNAQAAVISATGDARVQAGRDINLGTARERYAESHDYDEHNHARMRTSTETGTQITGGANVTLIAGRDVNARAAQVDAEKQLAVGAKRDVNVIAGTDEHHTDNALRTEHHGFLSSTTTQRKDRDSWTESASSTLTGGRTVIMARRDVTIAGSNVAAQKDLVISGDRNVTIGSAQNKSESERFEKVKTSGFGALGGISYGSRQTTESAQTKRGLTTGSTVGSVEGNVLVNAGGTIHVKGSDVLAPQGDITMIGRDVKIDGGKETLRERETHEISQSGVTVTASNPIVDALQTGVRMADASKKVDNPVMKGLAGATAGLAASNAYDAVQAAKMAKGATDLSKVGGVSIKLSLGSNESRSVTERNSNTSRGATVAAGKDLTIIARGAGQASGITVTGSNLSAGHNAVLKADGDILLQAAKNDAHEKTDSSSHGASVGIGFSAGGTQNGFTLELGANAARGKQEGHDTTWTNSHVTAGNVLALKSGGDTTLKGASAKAERILASVGGNLRVESQQDSSKYKATQSSAGVGVSLCIPPYCYGSSSVSGNVGHGRTNSDFKSTNEQTGLHAGNGGFQIDVKKNTALVGGVIGSSDRAVAEGRNQLKTGTLTTQDLKNKARYDANQIALGGGLSFGGGKGSSNDLGTTKDNQVAGGASKVPGSSIASAGGLGVNVPVVMGASGKSESTTRSGISGGTVEIRDEAGQKALTGKTAAESIASLNRDTKETQNSLKPIYDKQKVEAGFEIVSEAQRQTGQFLANRAAEAHGLEKALEKEPPGPRRQQLEHALADAKQWGPGGEHRRWLTAIVAAAGGNVAGAAGETVRAATVNYLQGLGATQVKKLVAHMDAGPKGEAARAALHAIVGCAGAAGKGAACSAGALGAGAGSVLNALLNSGGGKLNPQEKEQRSNLVQTLVAGIAKGAGADAVAAAHAAATETENNQLLMLGRAAAAGGALGASGHREAGLGSRGETTRQRLGLDPKDVPSGDENIARQLTRGWNALFEKDSGQEEAKGPAGTPAVPPGGDTRVPGYPGDTRRERPPGYEQDQRNLGTPGHQADGNEHQGGSVTPMPNPQTPTVILNERSREPSSKGVIKSSETIGQPVEAVINGRKRLLRIDIEPNGKLQIQSGGGKDSIVDFRPDLSKPLAPQIDRAFKRLPQSARDQLIRNAEKGLKRLQDTGNM